MFYSFLALFLLLMASTACYQSFNSPFTVVLSKYKTKSISDRLRSMESPNPKFILMAKSSCCVWFYGKLFSRYSFNKLIAMDSIIKEFGESVQSFAKVVWSPEVLACNSSLS